MNIVELKAKPIADLYDIARDLDLSDCAGMGRRDLVFRILKAGSRTDRAIVAEGVLESTGDGHGFLRSAHQSYLPGADDIYVSGAQMKRFVLRTGDTVAGQVRCPRDREKYFALDRVTAVNFEDPERAAARKLFEQLTPLYPDTRLKMEHDPTCITTRIVDMLAPIGKGQRGLVVSPPRGGKTVVLKNIARAINANHPEVALIILLIDERPEEVTDMARSVDAEVVASTFDEEPDRHLQVSDMVLEKAKRLVEQGRDVVLLLDSITRLARAHNSKARNRGKLMSGGIHAGALQKPKRFFGSARNVEEGGSLTIIATALVETGSRMDEVIFEEFKGTGNMEIVLDRTLAERRLYPTIDVHMSGTRKEELILDEASLNKIWILRKYLAEMEPVDAMYFLQERLGMTETNADFIRSMNQ